MAAIALCIALLVVLDGTWACPPDCEKCDAPAGVFNKTVLLVRAVCQHVSQMTTVPQDLPKNLGTLIFRSNGLKHLGNESLDKYPYLTTLDFSNNKLEEIVSGAFQKQRDLVKLILQDNNLNKLSSHMFIGLDALQKLFLQKNYISALKKNVFRHLKSLRVLNLHDNKIVDIETGTFEGLDFLRELDLSGCLIKKIGPGTVANLMSLEMINLSYNNIQIIDDDAFHCSPLVRALHLNNNSIVQVPDLHWLQFLQDLDVSENPISHIHSESFKWNSRLQSLNVSFCKLSFLQKETLAGLKSLRVLSIEGNPLHCDCLVNWLHQLVATSINIVSKPDQIKCKTPLKLAGRSIQEASAEDLKCTCNFCKQHTSCQEPDKQCSCTSGNEYKSCQDICLPGSKKTRCDYFNGQCLCSNSSSITEDPWKCHFQMDNRTCSKNAQLKKVKNDLSCVCDKGLTGNGVNCTDVNECNWFIPRCRDPNSICVNTIGSYNCNCRAGYQKERKYPLVCTDVNECKNTSICGVNGVCRNLKGAYLCTCEKGYHREEDKCWPLLLEDEIQVTVRAINSSAISLKWFVSAKKDMIAAYKILYLPYGPSRTKLIESPNIYPANATYGILTNLLPDTMYNIRIEVYMVYNATVRSQLIFMATKKNESNSSKEARKSPDLDVLISLVVLVIIIIIAAILIALYWFTKRRPSRRERDSDNINSHLEDLIELRGKDQAEGTSLCERERKRSEKSAVLDAWEIPRNQLKIGEKIGEGHFGVVLQGTLTTGENIIKVAVKTIKEADRFDMKDFMLEMEMMKEIGCHPNVVSLLGVSSIGAPLYIITEYAEGGNLLDLLRSSRCGSSKYANVASTLNSRDLLNIALDVSKGMRHVASKKLVHRDLAARNVLMSKDLVAKIGDFGLARDVYSEGIYVKTGGGRLPIKWMAPESIKDRAYTIKSDVWSFGILLWEIVTLGGSPYPSMPVNILLEKLLYGYRMLKPDHCSDEVYSIMEECWSSDPVTRPSFDFLCKELLTLLSEEGRTYINVKGLALDESDSELSNEQGNFSCNL